METDNFYEENSANSPRQVADGLNACRSHQNWLLQINDCINNPEERDHDTNGGDDQGAGAHLHAAACSLEPVREHLAESEDQKSVTGVGDIDIF